MDSRVWDRILIEKNVDCRIGTVAGSVLLYNLSAGGCMIEVTGLPVGVGDLVEMNLDGVHDVCGSVVWAHDGCAGVNFEAPLHEAIVRHLGFTPTPVAFEQQAPRDRFGRILPPIGAGERP